MSQHSGKGTSVVDVVCMFAKAKSLKHSTGGPPGQSGSKAELDHGNGRGLSGEKIWTGWAGLCRIRFKINLKFHRRVVWWLSGQDALPCWIRKDHRRKILFAMRARPLKHPGRMRAVGISFKLRTGPPSGLTGKAETMRFSTR